MSHVPPQEMVDNLSQFGYTQRRPHTPSRRAGRLSSAQDESPG